VFIRLFTFVLYLITGLGLGYLIWGVQVGNLTESLNRMVIEDDALRAQLARSGNDDQGKVEGSVMAALGTISEDLRKQNERIDQQGQRIERQSQLIEEQSRAVQQYAQAASASQQEGLKSALDQCSSSQDQLQHQVEQCLFEKAELQRALESARRAAVRQPRSGTSPIEETIQPAVPNDSGPAR